VRIKALRLLLKIYFYFFNSKIMNDFASNAVSDSVRTAIDGHC
jgi:hypothetical protein